MTHLSEDSHPLTIRVQTVNSSSEVLAETAVYNQVCLLILPPHNEQNRAQPYHSLLKILHQVAESLGENATLITIGEPVDLVHAHSRLQNLTYQLWISVKRQTIRYSPTQNFIPEFHIGALVHTRYTGSLQHTTTRLKYTYCPVCHKTTKDYGGKKHTYNSYGTLLSDVWRDIPCDLEGDLSPLVQRFADLFGLAHYQELLVLDLRGMVPKHTWQIKEPNAPTYELQPALFVSEWNTTPGELIRGDSLESLRRLPDNSVDFAFIDPPYNLGKNYNNYADDLSIQEYFAWCDDWIAETARVLRPGKTLALLNIPLWAIRHFLFMETTLQFQNWIAWDALSFPVRKIMPANYAIVCFSKGEARPLPGLIGTAGAFNVAHDSPTFFSLQPLAEDYCLRRNCVRQRNAAGLTDRGPLTDLWWDIHRLKHNSRRVDHPCQLPPQLLYRLISLFTEPDETVLDCFNGAGTTTLAAHQMGRRFIGIELSEKYYQIAQERHAEISQGLDPFRKATRQLTEKNSRVPRMPKQTYEVPKRTLQLEVRRVAQQIGHLPTREEMIQFGKYEIRYYDEYFASWGEVCAAARHDGMSETQSSTAVKNGKQQNNITQLNLFDKGSLDAKR